MRVISEHHFVLHSEKDSSFVLRAHSLSPYLITEGNWVINILFLAGSLQCLESKYTGFILNCRNVATDSGNKLILANGGINIHGTSGNFTSFALTKPPPKISFKSDLLHINIISLDQHPITFQKSGILGVSLVQVSYESD